MPRVPFESLPDEARLWIFPSGEPLDPAERSRLLERVESFLDGWAAHGAPLTGACLLEQDRFLLVAVDPRTVPPSGCSIDALTRVLKELEAETGKRLLDHAPIYMKGEDGRVIRLSRNDFRSAARSGEVSLATPVFDTTLRQVGAWRRGRLEIPAGESWHGPAFFGG